jgi:N-acetylglucosamine-6-phosphate deacetylase
VLIKNGLVFTGDCTFTPLDICVEDGRISALSLPGEALMQDAVDATDCYVLPGFVDIHAHGAVNRDLCDASGEGIEHILAYNVSQGITSMLLATMSYPKSIITKTLKVALPYINKNGCGAVLRGINMEGPFISLEKRGAQNPEYIMLPDFDFFCEVYELSEGHIRFIDLAPELEGSLDFIRKAAEKCTVSLAHTSANYDQALAAFRAGASHITHLFNGMTGFNHYEPGVIGAAADMACYAEIISDGFHVHPAAIRAAFNLFGAERICLISDSMRAAGMPNGKYDLGGQIIQVENGKAFLSDGGYYSIAGSVTNLADMCRRAVEFGIPLETAVRAATLNPAKAARLDAEVGSISAGKRADIVIWDKNYKTRAVISGGNIVHVET